MSEFFFRIKLESDTTFGRGDGVAGYIDTEVEHDANGLPFLRGRTLRGLLSEECANLLFSIGQFSNANSWKTTAENLFGLAGSTLTDDGKLHIGNAVLPEDLRDAVKVAIKAGDVTDQEIIESLTAIRRQTRINETGSPDVGSLRSSRVILRETEFDSDLMFAGNPTPTEITLLGACAASLQRVGLGRNRGRGKVCVRLYEKDKDITQDCLTELENSLGGAK
jgi:CRISPR/Cas system CMR subunit Cmr4 (Cas7 group RAMP superfamily)